MEHLELDSPSIEEALIESGAQALKPSFAGVVLVCGDCEERGNGPVRLTSKEVRKCLKDAVHPAKGQLRVAITGCLGPCPKKAMTVAIVAGGEVRLHALDRGRQVDAVGALAVQMVSQAAKG
jgi:hypothetical protein